MPQLTDYLKEKQPICILGTWFEKDDLGVYRDENGQEMSPLTRQLLDYFNASTDRSNP